MSHSRQSMLTRWAAPAVFAALFLMAPGCSRETSPEAVSKGQAALRNKDYPAAVQHLKRAAKLNPGNATVLYNLGMANLLGGDFKAAAKAFEKSEKFNPNDGSTDALEGLAEAYRQMGDYKNANIAIERAMGKVNRKAHLVAAFAAIEIEQGNYASAESLLSESLKTDPKDPVALFNMAVLQTKPQFDQPQEAAGYYVRFLMVADKTQYAKERTRAVEAIKGINESRKYEVQDQIDMRMVAAAAARTPAQAANIIAQAYEMDRSNPDTLWALSRKLDEARRPREAKIMRLVFAEVFPYDERAQVP